MSKFLNNSSPANGRAIYSLMNCTLDISSTVFERNSAGVSGEAIHIDTYSKLNATNVTFRQNSVGTNGRAVIVVLFNSSLLSQNCSFIENSAISLGIVEHFVINISNTMLISNTDNNCYVVRRCLKLLIH